MHRDDLLSRIDDLLQSEGLADYAPNGLQVEGRDSVERVVTGVTASLEFIERACAAGADAIVVHHGIFWDGASPVLRGGMLRRVKALLAGGVSLFAYHLPLDRHEGVGNNAPALRALGAGGLEPFGEARGAKVGWRGVFDPPVPAGEFIARVGAYYGVDPLAFQGGPPLVSTAGVVSGAAQGEAVRAARLGLSAFITGEVSEFNFHLAKEEGIHHLSVGHHASERVGPRELARWLRDEAGLDAEFLDVPNPV